MVPQNDPRLPEKVRRYGCYFRSLLAIAEAYCDQELAVGDIEAAYHDLVGRAMDADCTMNSQLALATRWAFRRLGHPQYTVAQVGIAYPPARFEFWRSARVYSVLKGLMHPVGFEGRSYPTFHFRLGDRAGRVIFDPYEPAPAIVQEDCVLLYQVVEVS